MISDLSSFSDASSDDSSYNRAVYAWLEENIPTVFLEHIHFFPELYTDPKGVRKQFRSQHDRVPNWASTEWGRLLTDPTTRDITTKQGRLFRRRFRLPFPFFIDWLVPACREHNIFEVPSNKNGEPRKEQIPLETKIMVSQRILARGS